MQYYWTISHVLETQFERIKEGWAPYNLKQHDYGLEVPTDNRADQTLQLLLFCVFILFSGPREWITSTEEKLCSLKQGMRESMLKVLGNPPLERKIYIYIARERDICHIKISHFKLEAVSIVFLFTIKICLA